MKKILIGFAICLTFIGCDNSSDGAKYINEGLDIAEQCGNKKKAGELMIAGMSIIESKEKANIQISEKEAKAIGRAIAFNYSQCEEKGEVK